MSRVCVVTGWVPLKTRHVDQAKYDKMAHDMLDAVAEAGQWTHVGQKALEDCHAYKWHNLPPSHYPNADRYAGPQDFTNSNIVQHERLIWGMEAIRETRADVAVWLDYGLLKQGLFTGRPVTRQHVKEFVERVAEVDEWNDLPFPGIWNKDYGKSDDPSAPGKMDAGFPWRFVGSTHIWPVKYLPDIGMAYYAELDRFVERTLSVPLDLPIWSYTELRTPWLPWRQYLANHDHTQLTSYYPVVPETELCEISRFYGCDKGGRHLIAGDTCHEYTVAYHEKFKAKRGEIRRVLEIGVNLGCSLRMWADYFPHAEIIGFDNDARTLFQEGRISTVLADQSSAVSLYQAMAKIGGEKFDIIIDDGSHEPEHQILTAQVLMPYLKPDGHYIIEDIHRDSRPDLYAQAIGGNYRFGAIVCPNGIGKAHDPETLGPERLVVIRHPN